MAKDIAKKTDVAADAETGGADPEAAAPKKRFGRKFLLIAAGGALVALLGLGGGSYFLFFAGRSEKPASGAQSLPVVPPQVAFYDLPDMVVNIQTPDGSPAYLKLGVALELDNAQEKAGVHALMPRVTDQFQSYLRELRVDDLRGSAGVLRLKEELLRRINVAIEPYRVRDVLLKEMIIQ
ncbi:MAG TPA: flagellar basal body-associated FliL family protein [Rhizomicrobium sp.]|jgi:flagellar FliL protein